MSDTAPKFDILKAETLPDSRAKSGRGAIPTCTPMGWMVPIYCANCGKDGGMVPEENTTFVFWICTPCFERMGHITGTMVEPDQVFWEKVKREQQEKYGGPLSDEKLKAVVESNTTPLATLIQQGR